jgi:hypothetical protein
MPRPRSLQGNYKQTRRDVTLSGYSERLRKRAVTSCDAAKTGKVKRRGGVLFNTMYNCFALL